MLSQDTVSIDEINSKLDQILLIESAIHKKSTANLLKHRAILTKEQQESFLKMISARILGSDRKKSKHSQSLPDTLKDK